MHRIIKNLTTLMVFFFVLSPHLSAGDLDPWFESDSRAPAYASIRADLGLLAEKLEASGIPVSLLLDRLSEGAAKKVPPAKLLVALSSDCADFVFIGSLYEPAFPSVTADARILKECLVVGSLILRSGVDRDDFGKCLPRRGSGGVEVKRSLDALLAVALVHRSSPLDSGQIFGLTRALVSSSEKADRFSSLSSLFVRARAGGLRQGEIAETVIGVFNRGSGFVQAETEISRRIK